MQLLNQMLFSSKSDNAHVITADPFCLKMAAICVFGESWAARTICRVQSSIDAQANRSQPNDPSFWFLECLAELSSVEDLKKTADQAVETLYKALQRFVIQVIEHAIHDSKFSFLFEGLAAVLDVLFTYKHCKQ